MRNQPQNLSACLIFGYKLNEKSIVIHSKSIKHGAKLGANNHPKWAQHGLLGASWGLLEASWGLLYLGGVLEAQEEASRGRLGGLLGRLEANLVANMAPT